MAKRRPVISAVFKKNFKGFFNNPTGYVFIAIFILACAYFQFSFEDNFFSANLADLAPLNRVFPFLLLFFIPVLTMNCWAEEKKLGTDEFLLTLPATDFQIVLGKFLAYLGIYAVSLLFSLTLVALIGLLGKPDIGLLITNYVAYILLGAAMIAIGMVGSLLTSNNTIGFIFGAIFNALFLLSGGLGKIVGSIIPPLGTFFEKIGFNNTTGLTGQFADLTSGLLTVSGFVYFIGATIIFLYLNMVLLGKRHWSRGGTSGGLGWHFLGRVAALIIGLLALNVILNSFAFRSDLTAEKTHSLSPKTHDMVKAIDKPVLVEAFISPDVPTSHANTRRSLVETLREFNRLSGNNVQVKIHDTEPKSDVAREARRKYDIRPRTVMSTEGGGQEIKDVFLSVAMKSGGNQQVIPYFGPKHPVEYELTRSVSVIGNTSRKGIGVLDTEAGLFGPQGPQGGPERSWEVVRELKKQYTVKRVSTFELDKGGIDGVDVLLVVSPSSLSQEDLDKLQEFILAGNKAILLVDPYPAYNPGVSPRMLQMRAQAPNMGGQPPPPPAANISAFLRALGVDFRADRVAWGSYNPHPGLKHLPDEFIFLGKDNPDSFNEENEVTSGLQEMVTMYPGALKKAAGAWASFTPLLKSGDDINAGAINWDDLFQWMNMFMQRQPIGQLPESEYRYKRQRQAEPVTLAAHLSGENKTGSNTNKIDAIIVADADIISDQFFALRIEQPSGLNFDNIPFFLNCVDAMTGDTDFVALRKKRPSHRTLSQFEKLYSDMEKTVATELEDLEASSKKSEEDVEKKFEEELAKIRQEKGSTQEEISRKIRTLQVQQTKQLEARKQEIADNKEEEILRVTEDLENEIRARKRKIQLAAMIGPPLIPLLFGGILLFLRTNRENTGASATRRKS